MLKRPIAGSLSPNTETDDVILAIKTLSTFWQWKRGNATSSVTAWFNQQFPNYHAVTFNSGRSALYAILQSFGIGNEDEVLVQAFTCVAAIEPVLWVGAKPVYVDIEKQTFNLNPKDLVKKISRKTKAIIVQHTFGIPADMDAISIIVKKHNLLLIEDCAHSLGATYKGKKVGSMSDAAFFSFGRDKVISSVFGGLAILASQGETLRGWKLQFPGNFWILQQLLHPILFAVILPLYNFFGIGKALLVLLQHLQFLSKPIYQEEYTGGKPGFFPKKFPNALAILALNQLNKLEKYNRKRVEMARKYGDVVDGAIYLRYPLLVDDPEKICIKAKKQNILLGLWYANIIDPKGVDLATVGYRLGSCPIAEDVAKHIINLPTYPAMNSSDAKRMVRLITDEQ